VRETGDERSFLLDGDTLTLAGHAEGDGYRIGLGTCSGRILPARADPCASGTPAGAIPARKPGLAGLFPDRRGDRPRGHW
jgi:hypothetical protein